MEQKALELVKSETGVFELNYNDPEVQKALRNTVAKDLTDPEYWIFAKYCQSTRLNPLKHEIWAIKTKSYTNKQGKLVEGKLQIMTGIAGYRTIANSYPQFDGMKTEVAWGPDKKPVSATCTVYRKDRSHPHICTVYFSEYYRSGWGSHDSTWDSKPATMIEKVAQAHALREAFPQVLNDLYIPEEMEAEEDRRLQDALPATKALPEPLPGPFAYKFNEADTKNEKFGQFLARRKVQYDAETGLYISPVQLEKDMPRLADFVAKLPSQSHETNNDDDDLPENWHEESNAKVAAAETNLSKAQKKAEKIKAKLQEKGMDADIESMNLGVE